MVREYDLYKSLGDVDIYEVFDVFEVEVPVIFLGTEGFSPRRDGRYVTISLGHSRHPVGRDCNSTSAMQS